MGRRGLAGEGNIKLSNEGAAQSLVKHNGEAVETRECFVVNGSDLVLTDVLRCSRARVQEA